LLLQKMGLEDRGCQAHGDRSRWEGMRHRFAEVFARKTRAQWCEIMQGADVCFAPVLDLEEAPRDPHNVARSTFVELDGVLQPAPAPRFSATAGAVSSPAPHIGQHSRSALLEWGWSSADIDGLLACAALFLGKSRPESHDQQQQRERRGQP
jgi:alpha-methylacyl-CoA racemase